MIKFKVMSKHGKMLMVSKSEGNKYYEKLIFLRYQVWQKKEEKGNIRKRSKTNFYRNKSKKNRLFSCFFEASYLVIYVSKMVKE